MIITSHFACVPTQSRTNYGSDRITNQWEFVHVQSCYAINTERIKKQEALLLKSELNTINFLKQCYNDPWLVHWPWEDGIWNESCSLTDKCLIVSGILTAHSLFLFTEHVLFSCWVIVHCLFCMHNRKGGFVLSNRSWLCLSANHLGSLQLAQEHRRLGYHAGNTCQRQVRLPEYPFQWWPRCTWNVWLSLPMRRRVLYTQLRT